jgi:DNA-binding transcriptional LysR family regulator
LDLVTKLEFLLALSRERHFGHAARACGVTQPTLSAGLRQLEAQFGLLLVQRGSRFQGLTPEGERVLGWARRMVADARALNEDVASLKQRLTGRLRLAAIPTALPIVPLLTTPFRATHPRLSFTILSRTSEEVLAMLEDLQIDAGLTYLDNERLGRVARIPLYRERYRLLAAANTPLGDRAVVRWADVAKLPLCLLTPDMQNRRIIDNLLKTAGGRLTPTLESNSMILLFAHVQTGRWASVMPSKLAQMLGVNDQVRSIPIVEPDAAFTVGLVTLDRDPVTPLVSALRRQAGLLAHELAQKPD